MKIIEISDEVHEQAKMLAEVNNLSVERLVAELVQEQEAWKRLRERASRGSREEFERVLAKVGDREPEVTDQL